MTFFFLLYFLVVSEYSLTNWAADETVSLFMQNTLCVGSEGAAHFIYSSVTILKECGSYDCTKTRLDSLLPSPSYSGWLLIMHTVLHKRWRTALPSS